MIHPLVAALMRAGVQRDQSGVQVALRAMSGFDGAARWRALHRFALNWSGDRAAAAAHLADLDASLPCDRCREHWRALLEQMPPDLADAERFFAWTVAAHNAVSAPLGKPQLSVPAARALYVDTRAAARCDSSSISAPDSSPRP